MKIYFREVRVSSTGRKEPIDVTRDIAGIVRGSGVTDGICVVHSMHSTSAIIINEHEGGLLNDLVSKVRSEF
ncbi:MAG TPA: YjbQ family protein, partial [Candidatus Methanomethylicus sp.]|nr:YjbQ family protein [Candidatus Methanomethylicus sp.]